MIRMVCGGVMLRIVAIILIHLQVIANMVGGLVSLWNKGLYVLPFTTNLLNVLFIIYGMIVLLWYFFKSFSPILVVSYFLGSMIVFIINVILYHSSNNGFLNIFHTMVIGTYIDFIINGMIVFLLIKQMLQAKDKQAKIA